MNFVYSAYQADGREESGEVEAPDQAAAVRELAKAGRTVFRIKPAQNSSKAAADLRNRLFQFADAGRLSQARLFLDLAVMTEAGLTLPQALRALQAGESVSAQRNAIAAISASLSSGRSAAQSFAEIDGVSTQTVAIIASGERSAQMAHVLRAIATQMMEVEARRKEFREALAYPIFLIVMMLAALGVIIFVLVPSLAPVFENSGRPPPGIIGTLAAVRSAALEPAVQVAGLLFLALLASLGLDSVRSKASPFFERAALSLPILGHVIHKNNSALYLGSLSMLIGGGTPVNEALALAADCNPLSRLRTNLKRVKDAVATGERLPQALAKTGQFDPKIISLLTVGDEVNRLPAVLARAAEILESEAKTTTARLLAAMTPAITIFLGLLVGGLIVSVMTALLSINEMAIQQ